MVDVGRGFAAEHGAMQCAGIVIGEGPVIRDRDAGQCPAGAAISREKGGVGVFVLCAEGKAGNRDVVGCRSG